MTINLLAAADTADSTDDRGVEHCRETPAWHNETMTDAADQNFEIRMPSGTDDPLSDAEIQKYRQEIDRLDRVILDAVKRRSEVSKAIGKTRMGSGGTRLVHTREVAIINQFRDELGEEGPALAAILLRLGRGRLG